MTEPDALVFVVDDDASVRDALGRLMRSVNLQCELFSSTQDFLQKERADAPSCLILDVRLPEKSGLDFQRELAKKRIHIPIVFITAHGDIAMSVSAMKAGAVDFLTKPFREQDLLDAIHLALARARATRRQQAELASLHQRLESLTPREREILPLVVSGLLNKQIAAEIGISVPAVKVHRSQPGNIRELENLMERSVIVSDGSALRVPLSELKTASLSLARPSDRNPDQSLDSAEREHILHVLRETGGRLSGPDGAARRLGLKRTTLQSKMQRLKITRQDYSSPHSS